MLLRPVSLCHDCEFGAAEKRYANTFSCISLERVHEGPSHCLRYNGKRYPVDVVILTAVREEYEAVRTYLHDSGKDAWQELPTASDGIWLTSSLRVDNRGDDKRDDERLRIVLGQLSNMGLSAAASLTALAVQLFRPSLVVMIGIAAGLKGKTRIGDIVIPSKIWDYGSGKWSDRGGDRHFQPRIEQHDLTREVTQSSSIMSIIQSELDQILERWPVASDRNRFTTPRILLKPMVSGAAVVNSKRVWDDILKQDDKVIALDMESYAVLQAVKDATKRPYTPQCVIAKSVCDFGFQKNKKYQSYAAFTSTQFLRLYLRRFAAAEAASSPCKTNIPWIYDKQLPLIQSAS